MGHEVTVYERADRIGGLLMYGIPNMKLEKSDVLRRVSLMEEEGVKFITQANVGVDICPKELRTTTMPFYWPLVQRISDPSRGVNLMAFTSQWNFLHEYQSLFENLADGNYISAKDKKVVVIGGGDTGTDCIATSLRHGAKVLSIGNRPTTTGRPS